MHGIRILDLTRVLAGPFATQQLADQGAEVIKVEPPGGDETRGFGPVVDGVSTYFLSANRNKRSIVLDLTTAAGRSVARRLIGRADVVVENFRPGVADRLGVGWEAARALKPDLVYVSIHAFGDRAGASVTGRPGYDIVLQAMGGSASITGLADGPPLKNGTAIADLTAGFLAAQATLLGLLHRERTGEGQRIVVNMLQAQAACLAYHATRYAVTGAVETRRGSAHAGLVPYDHFACRDGWLALGCGNDAIWQRLRRALELPDEPAWRMNVGRVAARAAVDAAVGAALAPLTVAEADALLTAARVPVGPILGVDQVMAHPAVEPATFDHPRLGGVTAPGPPYRSATTREAHTSPPDLDADRDAILADLGLDADAVAALAGAGAFGAEPAGDGGR